MHFEIDNSDKANIFFYNKKILIVDAYHPSYRTKQEKYCDGIINGALKWMDFKNK